MPSRGTDVGPLGQAREGARRGGASAKTHPPNHHGGCRRHGPDGRRLAGLDGLGPVDERSGPGLNLEDGEELKSQDVFAMQLPPGMKRIVQVYYTVANGPLTAGKFTASLGGRQIDGATKHYPQASFVRA